MEKRQEALWEALAKNEEETTRWKNYKDENGTAVENLDRFSKNLTVDVMVPIGRKAYMPGHLIHTNEVLVGHYQNYFSKCSAHKAKEIGEYRIKMAQENLEKLQTESNLWKNKLDKPYTEGVFPSKENYEIIEYYDEEKEMIWREQHKVRVKLAKEREKEERQANISKVPNANKAHDSSDINVFKMLEEAELMEELENELERLEIDDISNDTIKELMNGEMKLPAEKPRVAHSVKIQKQTETQANCEKSDNNFENDFQRIVKKTDLDKNIVRTNNNHRPNPEMIESNINTEDLDVDFEELPREVQIIKEQAKFLPVSDQIGFYEYQIKIMRHKLLTLPLNTQEDIDQKVNTLNILETLEELLEMAEDNVEYQAEDNISKENDSELEEISTTKQETNEEKPTKRRISFALQNETLEFRKNETISQMLPKSQQKLKEVIKHDKYELNPNISKTKADTKINDRKKNIIDRVEENIRFITENQSTRDFQLVDKILEPSLAGVYTLQIHFQHSENLQNETILNCENTEITTIPSTPADLYQTYLKNKEKQSNKNKSITQQIIFANAYNGEDKVKVPLLKEADRLQSYEDQRMEFCKPTTETKSILKNKSAVEREQHKLDRKNRTKSNKKESKKKTAIPVDEEEYMSAYYKVMNEVVEKPLTEPEPLPECKYIDAHTPKKRISRFKQNRGVTEKI
ncbi:unconventional prefoldin RPB5 interactor-like protein [Bactrocera dorsalis]|uniref:Unconventional prefoldin RPB5 interactor-like protein n=1 Tax=Bactrocera dorsalis TaxID=27457 RepID=A0A6I9VG79_BACDO|nr:unconventional prefoldin RPB5 interactor-like protein [Bactrocera dorsalis]